MPVEAGEMRNKIKGAERSLGLIELVSLPSLPNEITAREVGQVRRL